MFKGKPVRQRGKGGETKPAGSRETINEERMRCVKTKPNQQLNGVAETKEPGNCSRYGWCGKGVGKGVSSNWQGNWKNETRQQARETNPETAAGSNWQVRKTQ